VLGCRHHGIHQDEEGAIGKELFSKQGAVVAKELPSCFIRFHQQQWIMF
jgi:hypothetical protein